MLDFGQEPAGDAVRPSIGDVGSRGPRNRKKGAGRPRKRRKRDQALNIKCYSEEKAFLEELAEKHGVSMSRVCREIWGTVASDEKLVDIVQARLARVF